MNGDKCITGNSFAEIWWGKCEKLHFETPKMSLREAKLKFISLQKLFSWVLQHGNKRFLENGNVLRKYEFPVSFYKSSLHFAMNFKNVLKVRAKFSIKDSYFMCVQVRINNIRSYFIDFVYENQNENWKKSFRYFIIIWLLLFF